METPNIKGISLSHLNEFVIETFGSEALLSLLGALSPETAHAFERPFRMAWYPLSTLVEVEKEIIERHYRGEYSKAYLFGESDMKKSVGSVYRVILRFMEPQFLLQKSATLWSHMVSAGRLEVIGNVREQTAICMVHDIDPIHKVYCNDLRGSFMGALKTCGAREVRVIHPQCVLSGASHCRFELEWDR